MADAADLTDRALEVALREEIEHADMETMTVKMLTGVLSARLGVDLTERKGFIRATVDRILAEVSATADQDEDEADEEEGEGSTDSEAVGMYDEKKFCNSTAVKKHVASQLLGFLCPHCRAGNDDEENEDPPKTDDRGGGSRGGFTQEAELAPSLSLFLGATSMRRSDVTKHIWSYIRKHALPKHVRSQCSIASANASSDQF